MGFLSRIFGGKQEPAPDRDTGPLIVAFAELLFQGDEALLNEFRGVLADPSGFIARNNEALGYVDSEPDSARGPWDLLLDFAQARNWLWDVDWKEAPSEIVACVQSLVPAKSLKVNWDGLAAEHEETETHDFLKILATALRSAEFELVSLNRGNDSYPLAIMKCGSVKKAVELAKEIGLGKVDRL